MTSTKIRMARTIVELRQAIDEFRKQGKSVGLVPTMGALHAGHLSLVEASQSQCDATVVSIFVNPTQFAPDEDLQQYPRPLKQDLALLANEGVDLVFVPSDEEVFPKSCTTRIKPPEVALRLEGESRPSHFTGVTTVVLKLFNMCQPDASFFGQKDYQQALVIQHMVRDLNLLIEVVTCPIVREPDGLALSSRNRYLDTEERDIAACLHQTLRESADMIEQGEVDARVIMAHMTQCLIEGGVTETDYAVVVDAQTLEAVETINGSVVLLLAAYVGQTRLIDNRVVEISA